MIIIVIMLISSISVACSQPKRASTPPPRIPIDALSSQLSPIVPFCSPTRQPFPQGFSLQRQAWTDSTKKGPQGLPIKSSRTTDTTTHGKHDQTLLQFPTGYALTQKELASLPVGTNLVFQQIETNLWTCAGFILTEGTIRPLTKI